MYLSRRKFTQWLALSTISGATNLHANEVAATHQWHLDLAKHVQKLKTGRDLHILVPQGSEANVNAVTKAFSALTGVNCVVKSVSVDEITTEMILQNNSTNTEIDVALPATFGIPDLVEAGAIASLDDWASEYEPSNFSDNYLYRNGDYYEGKLYGYQTDGDTYVLFYNKSMLEDKKTQQAYLDLTGKPLKIANTWEDLDAMMAFFHLPDKGQYGGCLFRNPGYLVWEWWARYHAKGYFPVNDSMTPNIANEAGVSALTELIQASAFQSPNSRANNLFENWADFAGNNIFCNIGWGGTQKYLMQQAAMEKNVIHSPLPGPAINRQPSQLGYFNWGWNYTVLSQSSQPELAYLFTLFAVTPTVSAMAVEEKGGYFDPFRDSHYKQESIKAVYGESFLDAHKHSLTNCIPDFRLRGQTNYFDALRESILAALNEETTPQAALEDCSQQWRRITRRLGLRKQRQQWAEVKAEYPEVLRQHLKGG